MKEKEKILKRALINLPVSTSEMYGGNECYEELVKESLEPFSQKVKMVYFNKDYNNDVSLLKCFTTNYDFRKLADLDEDLADRVDQMTFHSRKEKVEDMQVIRTLKEERKAILNDFFSNFAEPLIAPLNEKKFELLNSAEDAATLFEKSGVPEEICNAIELNDEYWPKVGKDYFSMSYYKTYFYNMLNLVIPDDYQNYSDSELLDFAYSRVETILKANHLINAKNIYINSNWFKTYGDFVVESEDPEFVEKDPFNTYKHLLCENAIASFAITKGPLFDCDKSDVKKIVEAFRSQGIEIDTSEKHYDVYEDHIYRFLIDNKAVENKTKEEYLEYVLDYINSGKYAEDERRSQYDYDDDVVDQTRSRN